AGNAGYGIVTALTLRIYPIPKIVTTVLFLNQLGNNFHRNLTFIINISAKSPIHVRGIYLGSANELQPLVQEYIELTKPTSVTYEEGDLYSIIIKNADSSNVTGSFKVKSFFIDSTGLSNKGAKYLMRFVDSFKCSMAFELMLTGGGRVNDIRRNETAFVHRGFLFNIVLKVTISSEKCLQDLENFAKHFQKNYASYENYQNLIDKKLDNWQCRYYSENFERLVEVKRKYDPYNLFHWNQSIPTNTDVTCY
ncbi:3068_t:CDS:2, partial [Scutellospora calospora]